MKVLYQGSYLCSVKKDRGCDLTAETVFLSTVFEAVGKVVVESTSYRIKEARWDIYRSPDNKLNGGGFLPELNGVEAYFDAGRALKHLTGREGGKLVKEVLAECVRGAILAETYVFKDRGHSSADDYEAYWQKERKNACRYYTNLDRVKIGWFDHIGYHIRENNLYNKYKSFTVYQQNDDCFYATGNFNDSFHELNVQLSFDGEKGLITDCKGAFLRAPDAVCFENANHLTSLIGKNITGLSKKDVAKVAGGQEGCFHLVDIVYDTLVASSSVLNYQ